MQGTLDDDQLELQRSVRDVMTAQCPAALVRAAMEDPDAWRPLWKVASELGWLDLALGEEGLGIVELVAVLEACGEAAAPFPLASSLGLAAGALQAAAGHFQKELDELAGGAVGTLAMLGGSAAAGAVVGSSSNSPTRRPGAPFRYAGGRLTGRAVQVPEAVRADLIVVLAESAEGTGLSVVRPGEGVTISPAAEALDPTVPLADVELDVAATVVPVDLHAALARPLVASAAELVGLAAKILAVTVGYAKTRQQFGKPIGSFQGVKHRLADCYVAVERARGLVYAAAAGIESEDPAENPLLARAAAVDAATMTAAAGVQVHGAIGMTWEHDMHLYLRRAWQSAVLTGDSRALYLAAARHYAGAR